LNAHRVVHAKLVGMAFLWGTSWPAGKYIASALPPLGAAAWRFTFVTLIFVLWIALVRRAWPRLSRRQWLGLTAAGAVGVCGYASLFMLGLARVEASRAALVVTVNPVFTTLFAAWLFRERFNWRIGVGMFAATAGAVVVLTQGEPWRMIAGGLSMGDWLLVGCIAAWTGYTLIAKRLLVGIDAMVANAGAALFGTVMLWCVAWLFEPATPMPTPNLWSWSVGAVMLYLSLGATVLAYVWYFEGVATLGAGSAASYISLVPIFGVLASALFLGERLTLALIVGGTLVVIGMIIMNRARAAV
jgi:drug/metabolite transporter (DMT)-like permease